MAVGLIEKVVRERCVDPVTKEVYYQNVRKWMVVDRAVLAAQAALEETTTAEAEKEAFAVRRHREIRPSVQKIGWKG